MRWLIVGGIVFWGVLVWIVGILTGMQLRSSHMPCVGGVSSRADAGGMLPLRRRLSPVPTRTPLQASGAVRPASNGSLSAPTARGGARMPSERSWISDRSSTGETSARPTNVSPYMVPKAVAPRSLRMSAQV